MARESAGVSASVRAHHEPVRNRPIHDGFLCQSELLRHRLA